MKACIYGAGAIGGWLGVKLARAGCELSAAARGATLDKLRAKGLRLQEGEATLAARVKASASPAELGVQDRGGGRQGARHGRGAKAIRPLLGPDTMVLTAMNGVPWWFFQGFGGRHAGTTLKSVDPDGSIAEVPARHIIGCVVHASCALREPGFVQHHFGNKLIIGEPFEEQTARATRRAAGKGRLRDRALRADPEGRLVQAVGQHDRESGQRDDRRHHRPDPRRRACAASSPP